MSDGNFNRALLPKNELATGLRAGKAQMRQRAIEALSVVLNELCPDMDEERQAKIKDKFMELIRN